MYHILICDDEEDIVRAVRIYLMSEEYTFYTAGTGEEAIRILQKEEIHLVLLAIMMPLMDGYHGLD